MWKLNEKEFLISLKFKGEKDLSKMGNRAVKLNCKVEREIGNHLMTEFLTCRIINDANIQIFRNMDDKPKIEDIKKVANISVEQINRIDKPLTKVDLMAILIKINPIYKNNCYDLSKVLSALPMLRADDQKTMRSAPASVSNWAHSFKRSPLGSA